jgi:uncharacterized protein
MRVDVGRIPEGGERVDSEVPAEVLDIQDPEIAVLGPVVCRAHVVRVFDQLLVDGSLKVRIRFLCSRCAEKFETEVEEPAFHYDCVIEKGVEFVDLTEEIRESILLTFPVHPVCRSDCRGLCPKCGANRNRKPCRCEPPHGACWNALNGLALR